ncbi:MAG: hypothetical protein L0241_32180, partial [Planctomycetia bacterium]|nr:hypothetical protein [Planctomycetia bacterium]
MNPAPPERPSTPPPRLVDRRIDPPVIIPASVTRGFPSERLSAVESVWSPARQELARAMATSGRQPEHSHWDWTRIYRPEWHCLVAVECEGQVQGLMAVETRLRRSALSPNQWVLYVDYIEVAPRNIDAPGHSPQFAGVGRLLIAEAVRMSTGRTTTGRVGLHSLPQAAR